MVIFFDVHMVKHFLPVCKRLNIMMKLLGHGW